MGYSLADFSPLVGEAFTVPFEDGDYPLKLEEASAIEGSPREEGGFRLEFSGPADFVAAQAIYRIEGGGRVWEIFLVPVSRDSDEARYEAVFF